VSDDDDIYAELTHVDGWLNVKTWHGHRLEFVLRDAEERNQQPGGYYVTQLIDMLDEAFKGDPERGIESHESYGHVSLCLRAEDLDGLLDGLGVCDTIIERWIKRFNVDKMRDSR
jgi:hypothetical protein